MTGSTLTISIIMPAYNAAKTISQSIESVIKQSHKNWELLIIDDGSQDNTSALVLDFQNKDQRIKLIKLSRNGGLSNARNEGCRAAIGSFISFLDSDDLWHENKLEIQVNFHLLNPEIDISHTDFHLFDDHGVLKRPFKRLIDRKRNKEGQIYPGICYKNPIGILTVMVRRSLLNDIGLFDTTLWTFEDQDLWVKIAKRRKHFGYIPDVLAFYRLVPGSISNKTGRYKKAYKKFITKLLSTDNLNPHLLFRFYYRHFGIVYFKSHQYKLSRLYFLKSIQIIRFDLISLSTIVYTLLGIAKQSIRVFKSSFKLFI
jgi:teichuronic acid biosynthesis glycosyltransferase TuaG